MCQAMFMHCCWCEMSLKLHLFYDFDFTVIFFVNYWSCVGITQISENKSNNLPAGKGQKWKGERGEREKREGENMRGRKKGEEREQEEWGKGKRKTVTDCQGWCKINVGDTRVVRNDCVGNVHQMNFLYFVGLIKSWSSCSTEVLVYFRTHNYHTVLLLYCIYKTVFNHRFSNTFSLHIPTAPYILEFIIIQTGSFLSAECSPGVG